MQFRIEGIQPMSGEELRAALVERRDHWARVTLQDDQDPAYLASEEAIVAARAYCGVVQGGLAAGAVQPEDGPAKLRGAVERQRQLIELQNQVPGADMRGALTLIDEGIASAVALSNAFGSLVRVTIVGQFRTAPNMIHGGYKRLAVQVDDASLG